MERFIYIIDTGELYTDEGNYIGTGYAGKGADKNNPNDDAVKGLGPLPDGDYQLSEPFTDEEKGPLVFGLIPDPKNEMHHRGSFMIHGDSIKDPGNASEGCMVQDHNVRQYIKDSGCRQLTVVKTSTDYFQD